MWESRNYICVRISNILIQMQNSGRLNLGYTASKRSLKWRTLAENPVQISTSIFFFLFFYSFYSYLSLVLVLNFYRIRGRQLSSPYYGRTGTTANKTLFRLIVSHPINYVYFLFCLLKSCRLAFGGRARARTISSPTADDDAPIGRRRDSS